MSEDLLAIFDGCCAATFLLGLALGAAITLVLVDWRRK